MLPEFTKYGEYIWAAFGVAVGALVHTTIWSAWRLSSAKTRLERLEREDKLDAEGSGP